MTFHWAEYNSTSTDKKVSDPVTVTAAQLINPGNKILGPKLDGTLQSPDEKVTVIDVDLAFFQSIVPSLEELHFLSHSRSVNTEGKVVLGMNDDGCFSLCIGNRLPKKGNKNKFFLVSYEGHQDHLNGSKITGDYTKIRLVRLGDWESTANDLDAEFLNMMEALCDKGNGGVSLMDMDVNAATPKDSLAREALEIGYVALENKMRVGENSTSWYRGPLVPAPTKRESRMTEGNYAPYLFSDHAINYDPEFGMFNHAYSAAWQIGRVMALSDATFANGIFTWRADYINAISQSAKQKNVAEFAKRISGIPSGLGKHNIHTATMNFFSDTFLKVDFDRITHRNEKFLGDHLPGILSAKEKADIIENDQDPLIALIQKLKKK